jgi:transcriptional regulator with XRE-family HTH domain
MHKRVGKVEKRKIRKNIGLSIRTARKAQKLTQSKLADLVGTSRNTISYLEAGTHCPRGDTLGAIQSVLGL